MRVALLTREYPPEVYGGAGVHVEYLARALAERVDLAVHCFGASRDDPLVAATYRPWEALAGADPERAALEVMSADLLMAAGVRGASLLHSHTWYANLAGHLGKLIYGVPHVATTHSLEPLRPWKAEQLGGGYALSSFCERTALEHADAVIAVSGGMRADVLRCYPAVAPERVHVIHNGIDAAEYRPTVDPGVLRRHGIDADRPMVLFVGRITRQKGITLLLDAARGLDRDAQLVLCAGAPDTVEIGEEVRSGVASLQRQRGGVLWINAMVPRQELIVLLSHATVFVCPSVYEPFGLVNLEAMACATAVVATDVGGIPEIVVDGQTGHLVHADVAGGAFSCDAARQACAADLAGRVNELLADPAVARRFGDAGRERVLASFSWESIAATTVELYRGLAVG